MKLHYEIDRPGRCYGAEKYKRVFVSLPPDLTVREFATALNQLIREQFDNPNLSISLYGPGFKSRDVSEWQVIIDGISPRE